ncbi:glutamate-cysteine ligase/gamma-glutamylcysteinesynthetase [Striga asiatica]|uniref:Glutamate-cysteine ligase/gamma-glutamylcysteinesynthetase n=1 Tax=Striga asiatica TaxID=4170 RepID=A0A5A7NYF3_STRAF|nr:glutamate-cysteine ligase/gamma-glutamylcysteinesynthetase [Striga asiatica]
MSGLEETDFSVEGVTGLRGVDRGCSSSTTGMVVPTGGDVGYWSSGRGEDRLSLQSTSNLTFVYQNSGPSDRIGIAMNSKVWVEVVEPEDGLLNLEFGCVSLHLEFVLNSLCDDLDGGE